MDNDAEILSRLKFIGELQKGDKINTQYMFTQPSGIITSLSRSIFYKDNRGNTLNFCNDTISKSLRILENMENTVSHNKNFDVNIVVSDLQKAIKGMTNLKETYIEDTKLKCDLNIIITSIVKRIEKYIDTTEENKETPDIFTY